MSSDESVQILVDINVLYIAVYFENMCKIGLVNMCKIELVRMMYLSCRGHRHVDEAVGSITSG